MSVNLATCSFVCAYGCACALMCVNVCEDVCVCACMFVWTKCALEWECMYSLYVPVVCAFAWAATKVRSCYYTLHICVYESRSVHPCASIISSPMHLYLLEQVLCWASDMASGLQVPESWAVALQRNCRHAINSSHLTHTKKP